MVTVLIEKRTTVKAANARVSGASAASAVACRAALLPDLLHLLFDLGQRLPSL